MDLLDLTAVIPLLPLVGFLTLLVAGRWLGDPWAGWLATAAPAGSFAVTLLVFAGLLGEEGEARRHVQTLFEWVPVGDLQVDVGLLADPLSITMALFVTGISTLIHLYSVGYMHGDPRYPKFFLYLNLFVFSMLVLILADNFLLSFLGWEGVGACSYFLISFWFERESAATAGKKAFVTNRIGDLGFMIAMFLMFGAFGSLDYFGDAGVLSRAGALAEVTATAIVLLLFVGAVGKSAQLPLYVWLPDAMEGPTPVSALIHAATMVTAGVYLLVRINPLLAAADHDALLLIGFVGGATALFAATVACAQDDIKRVLAYSTVSQLGYMVLAVGAGAYVAAIFHMVTHAFFKALLFLGAGSVIHGLHEEQDMKRMGALRRWMPITWGTFMIGWLAIAGVPPFAGFWSKDEILLGAWNENRALWAIGVVTALLTAYYMSRQIFLVFYGEARWQHAHHPAPGSDEEQLTEPEPVAAEGAHEEVAAGAHAEPHESPWVMTVPLVVLAGLSMVGGVINLPIVSETLFLEHWLEPVVGHHPLPNSTAEKVGLAAVAAVAALIGIGIAWATWYRRRPEANAALEPDPLRRAWFVNDAYAWLVDRPGRAAARVAAFVVDAKIIDGAVNGLAVAVRTGGSQLRRVQNGFVRSYALGVAGGVALVLLYMIVRVGT